MADFVAIDLFCGAGGLTRGLGDAGISVALGIDVDQACKYAYEVNNPGAKFLAADISKIDANVLKDAWGNQRVRVLAGCAPCQPFSKYTQAQRWGRNAKWLLLKAFGRLVEQCLPEIVTMENVGSLAKHGAFHAFCQTLERCGYETVWDVIDCRPLGVPQSRRRLVLLASRLGNPTLPNLLNESPSNWISVRDAIGNMPPLAAGQQDESDQLHIVSKLSDINLKRIRASKPGGTWRDWPKRLVAPCHKKLTGKSYPAVYGRMEWDKPGPTITGQCFGFGNGRFGHPEQDRAISLREAAILQSFPINYDFAPPGEIISIRKVGQMIGNAVPPKLGKAIGEAIRMHVKQVRC